MTPLILLPRPQNLIQSDGFLRLPSDGFISLKVSRPAELLFAGRQIQSALDKVTQSRWQVAGGPKAWSRWQLVLPLDIGKATPSTSTKSVLMDDSRNLHRN